MVMPRKRQISLADTPYYHSISRCIRRSFLCGEDKLTNQKFEHRRLLIEEELLSLSYVFSIDISVYAVMSNHYQVIFCIDLTKQSIGQSEVIMALFIKNSLIDPISYRNI
jgi:hypothetical protein